MQTIPFYTTVVPYVSRSRVFIECGICCQFHRFDFIGDCREQSERYPYPPVTAERIVYLDERE